jgi:hypothetical protein
MKRVAALLLWCALPIPGQCQELILADAQRSHIQAHVPEEPQFSELLSRDLVSYFKASGFSSAESASFVLLRDGATQSGVAHPKYYAWVKVHSAEGLVAEGAVRVAAIERTHFEVTDFVSRGVLLMDPSKAASVFPQALMESVVLKARAK